MDIEKKLEELEKNLGNVNERRIECLNYAEELKQEMLKIQGAIIMLKEIQGESKDE